MRGIAVTCATALCVLALGTATASAAAPTISLTTFSKVTTSSATLEADINPEGKETKYHFEYGLTNCTLDPCTSVPVPDAILLEGNVTKRVSAPIEGLTSGTTYHFRAVAENDEGKDESPDRTLTTFILTQPFPPCENDKLRGGPTGTGPGLNLPDCRAYEQASPIDKNGTNLLGELAPLKATVDGEGIVFESASGIPGAEGGQNFPFYLSSREEEGWSTQGLLPKAKAGDGAEVTGWTPDLAWSFATAKKTSAKEGAFFARSSADGTLIPIVDYISELFSVAFAGASPDGAKVFFETGAELPGAPGAAGQTNLYAWDRESEELRLAGVLPDGSTPPGGSVAGPYDWVKGTGEEALGSGGASRNYYTQDTNAVSGDGSRAFFTAGDTGQLYLREDPTSLSASTEHVSASQKNNGSGPGDTDAAGPRPAAFQAASADGSVAFLTSSEKLTNDATTGPEPTTFPAIGRAEIDGESPDPGFFPNFASGADTIRGLTVDNEYLYWADPGREAIGRAKLDKSEPEAEFIEVPQIESEPGVFVEANPQYVAVDGEYVYWTNAGALDKNGKGAIGKGTIARAKLNGDDVEAEFIKGQVETSPGVFEAAVSNPQGIAVDGTYIYWANSAFLKNNSGTIGRAEIGGDPASVEPKFIEMPSIAQLPQGVAVNATQIYWTRNQGSPPSGSVRWRTLDGNLASEKSIPAGENTDMRGIALDAEHVYWSSPGPQNAIGRAKLDLTEVEKEFIEEAGLPQGLAVDDEHLHWAANQKAVANPGNDLYRYDVEAEELTDLVVDTVSPNGAEVRGVLGGSQDGSHLYFAANGDLDGGGPATKGDCQGGLVTGNGACNLYLWRDDGSPDGVNTFIARLETGGGEDTDAANWTGTPSGVNPNFTAAFQKTARISPNGRTLLFRSQAQLSDFDNDGVAQLYRYDADSESLLCVSCNPTGATPSEAPTLGSTFAFVISAGPPASLLTRNLSEDGERVFFESTEALVPEDTNGEAGCPTAGSERQSFPACRDAYMWEANGEGSCEGEAQNGGCLHLLSSGKSAEPSFFADAGADGEDAFILTSSRLVPQDRDDLYDFYDARVKGGLASQNQPPLDPCLGIDPCHEPPPAHSQFEPPGSTSPGPPDPLPKRKKTCPKGKRQVKAKGRTRCVPKRSKRQNAKTNRRASR